MSNKSQYETALMNALEAKLRHLEVPLQIEEAGNGRSSISAQFKPRKNSDLILDYTFSIVPDLLELTPNFLNFQSFVYLSGRVNSQNTRDLQWMTSIVNPFIPIGAFGVFDRFDILYWKQNNYLDGFAPVVDNISLIVAQTVFSQEIILDFRQTFLDVISKQSGAEESLRANKWASVVFGNSG